LLAAVVLAGATNLAVRTVEISPHDLRTLIGERAEIVTVRGVIAEPPEQRVFERDEEESWRTHVVISVTQIIRKDGISPAVGDVAALVSGVLDGKFFTGREVEATGVLQPPRGLLAEGLFDYRTYLQRHGIHFQLTTKGPQDWRALGDTNATAPWADRFNDWARVVLGRGLPVEDEPLRLTWGMAMGWKTALTDEVSEPFMRTGTMHIFAISGLHIAFIAGIIVALLRVARVSRGWCGVVAIPLIWFYTAATGWQASAIRSTVMMTIIIAGWALRRPSNLLNSLGAAAFIILVWDPQQMFQASFQLSFFVVLAIALLLPPIEALLQRLLAPDPLLPPELRPRWRRWLDPPVRWVTLSLATSFASWLGSMPLTALYFHLFTPISLLANLIIVPLSSLALACNLGSVLTAWLPFANELFNHAGWFFMWAMVELSQWFARLPGAFCHVREPAWWEFAIYYVLLAAVFSGWLFRKRRWLWATPVAVVLIASAYSVDFLRHRDEARITIIPLNGGEAVWVDAPRARDDLLVDVGNTNAFEFVTRRFLRGQGVNQIPTFALTHGDLRNVGAALMLEPDFRVGETAVSSVRFRSAAYRRVVDELAKPPRKLVRADRGATLADWAVLHPAADDKVTRTADGATVLRGEFHGVRVLLLSDLGKLGQRTLLERERDLRADILVAGLPRGEEPLSDKLIEVVQPKLIIITDSLFPSTERATKATRERLLARGVPVFYTSERGAVKLTLGRNGWRATAPDGTELASGAAP
ncbi:MAG: ComEC/Rec2 family competence protein, partial [Verrucomicrobia bacterium]|nr:ComEC/Rec2 family competence protein [Verrucomicrobiota bacterium]